MGGNISPEQPPKGEHASNGVVEEAGKTSRDTAKVLTLQLASNLGRTLQMKEPTMHWLIRWAAMALWRYQVGKDHKTAAQRQTGRACNVEVVPFAEKCWHREAPNSGPKVAMESKLKDGLWLGHSRGSNEVLVGNKEGIVKAYAIRRRSLEERWDDAMNGQHPVDKTRKKH